MATFSNRERRLRTEFGGEASIDDLQWPGYGVWLHHQLMDEAEADSVGEKKDVQNRRRNNVRLCAIGRPDMFQKEEEKRMFIVIFWVFNTLYKK